MHALIQLLGTWNDSLHEKAHKYATIKKRRAVESVPGVTEDSPKTLCKQLWATVMIVNLVSKSDVYSLSDAAFLQENYTL